MNWYLNDDSLPSEQLVPELVKREFGFVLKRDILLGDSSKCVLADVPSYRLVDLGWVHTISGPCTLIKIITTIIVEENCIASIVNYCNTTIDVCPSNKAHDEKTNEGSLSCEPIKLSICA